jgi:hypothetical protein
MLVLAAAGLTGMVYALSQGDLWAAGLLAFNGIVLLMAYRTEKQLERSP